MTADDQVVLLGSIASDKYLPLLAEGFGSMLRFPHEFVGRGDMSRGGLMLRRAAEGRPLDYVAIDQTPRTGKRPAKLQSRRRSAR
jgi:hypothetical protein